MSILLLLGEPGVSVDLHEERTWRSIWMRITHVCLEDLMLDIVDILSMFAVILRR